MQSAQDNVAPAPTGECLAWVGVPSEGFRQHLLSERQVPCDDGLAAGQGLLPQSPSSGSQIPP